MTATNFAASDLVHKVPTFIHCMKIDIAIAPRSKAPESPISASSANARIDSDEFIDHFLPRPRAARKPRRDTDPLVNQTSTSGAGSADKAF